MISEQERQAIDAVRVCGQKCRGTWGLFITKDDLADLDRLLQKIYLSPAERLRISTIVDWTAKRASQKKVRARYASPKGVDWPADRVISYIKVLTGRDQDHARLVNRVGWNDVDSSTGHWCHAMLNIDQAIALKIGRGIVGKYETQLTGQHR